MTTVSGLDQWFDENAENLMGLPIAEAVHDVLRAGLRVEVTRRDVRRVRDRPEAAVALTADRRGVVTRVAKVSADRGATRSAPGVTSTNELDRVLTG